MEGRLKWCIPDQLFVFAHTCHKITFAKGKKKKNVTLVLQKIRACLSLF